MHVRWSRRWLSVLLLSLWSGLAAQAQHENDIWYFGNRAGLSFASGGPVELTDGALVSGEGCASSSDAQGRLQFYTNGINVWNRQHQVMAGGSRIGGYDGSNSETVPNSATQGALIVPRPGSAAQYYVFTVDAAENYLNDGLQYAVVDMSAAGGVGQVVSQRTRLPTPTPTSRVTEKLAGLRHPNGVDTWVLVHGWETNEFMAFRVSAAGVAAPVVSAVGAVHQGGTSPRDNYNALGYLKFSPDGLHLAVMRYAAGAELFDFDPLTGQVSNPRALMTGEMYGAEFSPSGQMLYLSDLGGVWQYDLRTTTRTLLTAFATRDFKGALLLGPDGRIYQPVGGTYLTVIDFPELPGLQCGYRQRAITLSRACYLGLPNPVVVPRAASPGPYLGFTYTTDCRGLTLVFTASMLPASPGATYRWNFGEPASPGNTAVGAVATHSFARFGTFRVTVQATLPGQPAPLEASAAVTVVPPPGADLGPAVRLLCPGQSLLLGPVNAPYPAYFQWEISSLTSSTRSIDRPGLYWLQVTTLQGCVTRDTVRVYTLDQARLNVRADTSVFFERPVRLRVQPRLPGVRYRWSDGSTADSLVVARAGTYWVEVRGDSTSPAGCVRRLTRTVGQRPNCQPVLPGQPAANVPNVITPNGDGRNDAFVVPLPAGTEWRLEVFNRWGRLVYQAPNYRNDWSAEGQPAGVYFYRLTDRQNGQLLKGWVEVVR